MEDKWVVVIFGSVRYFEKRVEEDFMMNDSVVCFLLLESVVGYVKL